MTPTLIPYASQLLQSIGWSLLHSLWQGAVVWLILAAVFRAFPALNARLKHGCALMALLLLTLWVVNTAITQWQQIHSIAVRVTSGDGAAMAGYLTDVQPQVRSFSPVTGTSMPGLEALIPWLMLCYGIGLLAMLVRLGGGLAELHALRRRNTSLPTEPLQRMLHSLQLQLGITQTVLLRLSTRVVVPVVIGALRPLILLPATMVEELGPEGLEAILLHELAHISRADFLINIFQSVIETLLFFNPFVWQISAALRREREHCCDDLVVAHTHQPLAYARALTSLARHQHATLPDMALAATGHQPLLFNRIKRIIEMNNHPLRYGQIIAAFSLAAIIIAVSIVCFTPSLAQHSGKEADSKNNQQKPAATTGSRTSILVTDSHGIRHEYSNIDELPAAEKEQLEKGLKSLKDAHSGLKQAQQAMRAADNIPAIIADAPIAPASPVPPVPPVPAIDWTDISMQVDSALGQVADIDWHQINREISKGMAEAEKALCDPRLKKEWRRGLAMARREIAANMPNRQMIMTDSRRSLEDAQRSMQQARLDMEQAREQMEQARQELERQKETLKRLKHTDK